MVKGFLRRGALYTVQGWKEGFLGVAFATIKYISFCVNVYIENISQMYMICSDGKGGKCEIKENDLWH